MISILYAAPPVLTRRDQMLGQNPVKPPLGWYEVHPDGRVPGGQWEAPVSLQHPSRLDSQLTVTFGEP
jgi:hypothetical protein